MENAVVLQEINLAQELIVLVITEKYKGIVLDSPYCINKGVVLFNPQESI